MLASFSVLDSHLEMYMLQTNLVIGWLEVSEWLGSVMLTMLGDGGLVRGS